MNTEKSGIASHRDVCLVMPPVTVSSGPSLALGLLKAALVSDGISCRVDYADMYFNTALGMDLVFLINSGEMNDFLGEYIFAPLAGIETEWGYDKLKNHIENCCGPVKSIEVLGSVKTAEKVAVQQVEETAARILACSPHVVGCSSCFQQRNAALAILKRVKELDPSVVTVMGGANCFGRAGLAVLRTFSYVDYVFFGEADEIFAPVIRGIMDGNDKPLPYGVLSGRNPLPDTPPHRITENLDVLPYPDYDDYFELVGTDAWKSVWDSFNMSVSKESRITLFLEGSRGCYWGERHPCTFCGLMGKHRTYRSKSPERFFREICFITEKYGITRVNLTDAIMPQDWPEKVFPLLKNHPVRFSIFTEMRTAFSVDSLREMKEAGFDYTQPGIESLSQHTLELMHKGVSALNNLTYLKYSRKYDISPAWNIIFGFPGEVPEDYTMQTELIPLLEHIKPPNCASDIVFSRDSEYVNNPDAYGLKLKPKFMYHFASPSDAEYLSDIAVYYDNTADIASAEIRKAAVKLSRTALEWQMRYNQLDGHIRLDCADMGDSLLVIDTRRCRIMRAQLLIGAERDVYRICDRPAGIRSVIHYLDSKYSPSEVSAALTSLMRKKLLIKYMNSFFALAVCFERNELVKREIEDFLYFKGKNRNLCREFNEHMSKAVSSENNDDTAVLDRITAFAHSKGMYFTGNDLAEYYGDGGCIPQKQY